MSGILVKTFKGWFQHKIQLLAAAFTFYALLSLGPLLVISLTIISFVLDGDTARIHVIGHLAFFVGPTSAAEIGKIIDGASSVRHKFMATGIGFVLLYTGASAVFGALHEAMNVIWDVPSGKRSGFSSFLRKQVIVVIMVVVITALFLFSIITSVSIGGLSKEIGSIIEIPSILIEVIDFILSVIMFTFLFSFIFRIVPDVKNTWRSVRSGAFITSVVFNCGKFLMSRLVSQSEILLAYGSLASFILIIIWVYISAQILLIGAEFTSVYILNKQEKKKNPIPLKKYKNHPV